VFYCLSSADKPGIEGRRSFVILDDLLAFLDDANNGRALLAVRLLVDRVGFATLMTVAARGSE
jgi:hypothetical protein